MLLLKMYNPTWRNWNVVYHRAQYWAQWCLPHIFFLSVTFCENLVCNCPVMQMIHKLYIPYSQNDNSCLGSIEECISEIQIWMKANFLKLNAEKTETIILSSPYFAKARTHDMIINFNVELIHPDKAVRSRCAIFDNTMHMESHVHKICQTAYIHLRNISKIRPYITKDACESSVHAFITSRLDSVNAVLYGLPKFLIENSNLCKNFQHGWSLDLINMTI